MSLKLGSRVRLCCHLSHLLVVDVAVLTLAAVSAADPARGAGRRGRGAVGSGARGDHDAAGRGAHGVRQVLQLEEAGGPRLRLCSLCAEMSRWLGETRSYSRAWVLAKVR